ncbi:hypothetical protein [Methylobacterium sp. WL120]|uniref:hypothetical protein n=1 Tax=Methylobacterium sp. WL120 TaxID=2603887 RepID=UPI00164FFAFA|nr:hypothetical protein [Methylobacterium sp. WL120]
MGNGDHLLTPAVAAAAAAIANNRNARTTCGGVARLDNILDILPEKLFAEVVEDARAAIQAAAGGAAPPAPRARGPLNAADASALGLELGAGTLLILTRDRASRARAAIWAAGVSASVLDHDEAQQLWAAFAGVVRAQQQVPPA